MRSFRLILCLFFIVVVGSVYSQNVGIGTTNPASGAILDLVSTDKGLLIPRLEASAVANPVQGLMIFQPSTNAFMYHNGSAWEVLGGKVVDVDGDTRIEAIDAAGNDEIKFFLDDTEKMKLSRNAGGDLVVQPINSNFNTFFGLDCGLSSTGGANTSVGRNSFKSNNVGIWNTSMGAQALQSNLSGNHNVAIGAGSLLSNTEGSGNVAIGNQALVSNTVRNNLVAVGDSALFKNGFGATAPDHGEGNVAVGSKAMLNTTTGRYNTVVGNSAMRSSTGLQAANVIMGYKAFEKNTSGSGNTAIGTTVLFDHTSGGSNTVIGTDGLGKNTTGSRNVAVGWRSGLNSQGSNNVFIGTEAGSNETGSDKLYIENSSANSSSALIYGEFDNDYLRMNANLEVYSGIAGKPSVYGENNITIGFGVGVKGQGNMHGVHGIGELTGVFGESVGGTGVKGESNNLLGVHGLSELGTGVKGSSEFETGIHGEGGRQGVVGIASGTSSIERFGVYGSATNGVQNYSIYGAGPGSGANDWAGYFAGKAYVDDRLGIGIETGNFPLNVKAKGIGNDLVKFYDQSDVGTWHLKLDSDGDLGFTETNVADNRLVLEKGGFIGLALSNPSHPLHLGSGAHCTSTGVWTNASDRRLKKEIQIIPYGLNEIMSLHPVAYKMKSNNTPQVGFIAQEIQEIIPELVSGKEGDIEEGETLGMSYGQLTSVIVKAMQEQQNIIDVQNSKIEKLENKLSSQTSEIDLLKAGMAEMKAAIEKKNQD